jgi:hypothetical protein
MDETDLVGVEAAVALMRRLGVKRLGSIELWSETVPLEESKPATPAEIEEMLKGPPEGDDALYWSTTGPLPSEYRDAATPPKE